MTINKANENRAKKRQKYARNILTTLPFCDILQKKMIEAHLKKSIFREKVGAGVAEKKGLGAEETPLARG